MTWWMVSGRMSVPGAVSESALGQAARSLGGSVACTEDDPSVVTAFLAVMSASGPDAEAEAGPWLVRAAGVLGAGEPERISARPVPAAALAMM